MVVSFLVKSLTMSIDLVESSLEHSCPVDCLNEKSCQVSLCKGEVLDIKLEGLLVSV